MDVLRWAEAVAPLAQGNNGSTTPDTQQSAVYPNQLPPPPVPLAPPPPSSDPVDWNARFASFLAAALISGRQPSNCPNTSSSSSQPLHQSSATEASTGHPLSSLKMADSGTMDSMMAAAFAAATAAAATVAMQQQQQQQQLQCQPNQPVSMSPLSGSGSSPAQTQTGPSTHLIMSQHASPSAMPANVAPGSISEVRLAPSECFRCSTPGKVS